MDRGKKPCTSVESRNNNIHADLKDIIRENALRYLPAKSLHRFSCVCRGWKNYISTSLFAHIQSNYFHQISGFFRRSRSSLFPSFISLDPMAFGVPDPSLRFLPEPVDVRCSSNGLLCCQAQGTANGYKPYYICNPVNQQWKKLPKPRANHGSDPALVLVFEPALEKFVVDYRLICAFKDTVGYKFDIYSSDEESWRTSREIRLGNGVMIIPDTGVYVNDCVYWRSRINEKMVIAFDLTTEKASLLFSHFPARCLGNVNGKLYSGFLHDSDHFAFDMYNAVDAFMRGGKCRTAKDWSTKELTLGDSDIIWPTEDAGRVLFIGGETMVIYAGATFISQNKTTNDIKPLATEEDDGRGMIPYVNSLVEL
ncbi:hypothetical protein MANES_18G080700v8 [Manihot esculenta]|uniref:Uncharacterized protein n=1 Tax=Manihot esculenta TaxID=3983 RepID=A0ACB7G0A8_MANES|nr:hypothetical protein MANES_18G080700v8 [Manihot esculenta]